MPDIVQEKLTATVLFVQVEWDRLRDHQWVWYSTHVTFGDGYVEGPFRVAFKGGETYLIDLDGAARHIGELYKKARFWVVAE